MPLPQIPVYDPAEAPPRGIASFKSRLLTHPGSGWWYQLQNLRWGDSGIFTIRNGTVNQNASAIQASSTTRSFASLTFQGTAGTLVSAFKSAANLTSCYLATDSTGSWTNITPSTGAYGDTRLASDGSGNDYEPVFQVVHDRFTGKDCIVFCNGYDYPRVYDGTTTALAKAIAQPTFTAGCYSQIGMVGYFTINSASSLTKTPANLTITGATNATPIVITTSGNHGLADGQFVTITGVTGNTNANGSYYAKVTSYSATTFGLYTDVGLTTPRAGSGAYVAGGTIQVGGIGWDLNNFGLASPDNYLILQTASTSGFSGAITYACSHTITWPTDSPKQLIITLNPSTSQLTDFLATFKISVHATGAAAGTYTLYDPTAGNNQSTLTIAAGDPTLGITHLCLAMDGLVQDGNTAIDKITFTPITTTYTMNAALNFTVLGITAGGTWPGATQFQVGYKNSASRTESLTQTLLVQSSRLQNWGMSAFKLPTSTWPVTDVIYYSPTVYFLPTSQAEANNGTDTATIYAELTNETAFTYITSKTIATYGAGVWTRDASYASNGGVYSLTIRGDIYPPTARLLWYTAPSTQVAPIPIGRAMGACTGSRLLVGARSVDSSNAINQDAFPRVCLSQSGFPFRFAFAPDLSDPTTAYEDSVSGESIQGFVSTAASTWAAATTYAFSDKAVWLVDPISIGTAYFIRRVSTIGTGSPRSIAENRGRIYFVDTNLQARLLAGAVDRPISLGYVNDKLTAIPSSRTRALTGAWYNFRYYLGYSPNGATTNTRCLVYSENANSLEGGWESDDLIPNPATADGMCVQNSSASAVTGTYGVIGSPKLLMIGANGKPYWYETGSTDLGADIAIKLTTGLLQNWGGMVFKRVGILCDSIANKVMTIVRTYLPTGGTATSTCTLTNTYSYDWTNDSEPVIVGTALGVAGNLDFSGSFPGGIQFHGIRVEPDERLDTARGQG